MAPETNEPIPVNQTPPEADGTKPDLHDMGRVEGSSPPKSHKEVGVGLAVGLAVLIALALVLIGVLAYQKSDATTDIENTSSEDTVIETVDQVSNDVGEIDTLIDEVNELDEMQAELDETAITDEALGID